jgi:hypothetical protein
MKKKGVLQKRRRIYGLLLGGEEREWTDVASFLLTCVSVLMSTPPALVRNTCDKQSHLITCECHLGFKQSDSN